ncbi:MAG TPA: AI-2E family transporter [Terriglobales bacterium]|nr:AI-2E family transporter [Terriglobales bacterium]
MELWEHLHITGGALKRWLIAQTCDAVAVATLWLVGLTIIGIPWAPLWAVLGGLFQFVPNIGGVLTLIGPATVAGLTGIFSGNWQKLLYLLILYAVVVVVDGLVLQPAIMKRTAKVPIWASLTVPIVLGLFLGFWGVLISAPLLAVVFAYRSKRPESPAAPR